MHDAFATHHMCTMQFACTLNRNISVGKGWVAPDKILTPDIKSGLSVTLNQ